MPCQRDYTTWMIHISLCFPHVTIKVRRAHMLPTSSRPSNNCMRQGDFRRDKNECRIANLSSHRINSHSISLYFFFLCHFFFWGGWGGGVFVAESYFFSYLLSLFCSLSLFSSLLIHFLFPITPSPPPSIFLFPFFTFILWTNHIFSSPATVIFKFRQDIY